ncbi:nucleotidyltransferase family protein [Agriterribacter sp.]|uniref:nucleotidyltransferase family protein n=1 Tax=Agriterribacter sp. TaxID=2821509 RepID=UPI002B5CF1F6|nr:nucleotidyltransferase family protein [Agriterribacter sp.]HRP54713.1 nucleotidyltransferase family protein [Agriterribacter sp.]
MMSNTREDFIQTENGLTAAMIFAAGLGTRLKPWTDHRPKALALVNGKPLLQRNIEYLQRFGIVNLVINVHHFAGQVIDFLKRHHYFNCNITVSHEKEEPLETGGGLKKAAWFLRQHNPFFVINADILTNLDINTMLQFHRRHKPLVTLAVTNRKASRSFLFNNHDQLCGWRNNVSGQERISIPAAGNISKAFSGIHIIDPAIFELITEEGKFSLVDLYLRLSQHHSIMGYDHSGDVLIDVGKPEAIEQAERYFH